MRKAKPANHVQVKLAVTPPPSKTWHTLSYHLDHYTIRQHVRVVTVQLHGVRGHEKRTETISFPLLQGVPETDLVRAAVCFSPNKWTVSFGMNVSQFHGKFSQQVDEQLLHALMNPSRSTNKRQPAQKHASPGATTASLSPQSQPSFAQTEQFHSFLKETPQQPPSFYSQPTQMVSGQFQPSSMNNQASQSNLGQLQPPNTYPQPGQFLPPSVSHQHRQNNAAPLPPLPPYMQPSPKRSRSPWIVIGVIIGAIVICGGIAMVLPKTGTNTNQSSIPTTAPTQGFTQATVDNATDTPLPTQQPSPTPQPKATPTLKPVVYVTPKPTPVPTRAATPTPCPGVNCNPWGYNFNPGNLIYNPPSNFCSYFNCIPSFWGSDDPGDGYIVQCVDGSYSQSGGESGACSYHAGVSRPLYSH